jgi:hypothetical protein
MINRDTFAKTHEFHSLVNFGETGENLGEFHVSPVFNQPNTYRVWGFPTRNLGKMLKVSELVAKELGVNVWVRGYVFNSDFQPLQLAA